MSEINTPAIQDFIIRWKTSGASERANCHLFITELCELIGVEKPRPASDKVHEAEYTFERPVTFNDGEGKTSTNYIDLYKKDCFVLEAKQGADKAITSEAELLGAKKAKTKAGTATRETRSWEREMKKAKEQALRYARSLPTSDGWPPFLVVVDVGFCIDLYSDFARQGKTYVPFPDPQNYRITLEDLHDTKVQSRLRNLFSEPLELDPTRRAAKVTRELAGQLALLASSLEQAGHKPEKVAGFLMRCLFTMFAEDVHLLPNESFSQLLLEYRLNLSYFPDALASLWENMDRGGFDPALRTKIPQFNGYLFKNPEALPVTEAQLELLIQASDADWAEVEPAIFGTLLERALQPRERHKLGAHYTPRAYVERLVMPTVIEPLREEWEAARTASTLLEEKGDETGAKKEIEVFHRRLCSVRILDPACGSGNFLYVTLEHLKRLEGEVLEYLDHFPGQKRLDMSGGYTVTPQQLLGIEVNPRAAAIADVVLWIGYLQWHFRTHGNAKRLGNPILREYHNIKHQDAVLNYSVKKPRLDVDGECITRWDGRTTKPHLVTGKEVPDESARTPVYDYLNPKPTSWPEADFIVGNPPFIGDKAMRSALGDGYVQAIRKAYKGIVPESADFVMYWWNKAAEIVRAGKTERFGFITTNSIKQTFNRKVIQEHIDTANPLSIVYAIPDHPWVDSIDGAAVRIAMTVGEAGTVTGRLSQVIRETDKGEQKEILFSESEGKIHADLKVGADVTSAIPLKSNQAICGFGMMLAGSGFIVTPEEAKDLGLGKNSELETRIRPYRNGRDLTSSPRGVMLIDMFGLTEAEVRVKFPEVYQHLITKVKPERDQNNRKRLKEKWWLFGECRQGLRAALKGLKSYISTPETAKHRFFVSQDISILPDHKLVNFALDNYYLGILTSKFHTVWSLAAGGRLGVGNDPVYNKSRCFDPFPFPAATNEQKTKIRKIANELDNHRKERQKLHPSLTITDMYNVLEKLKKNEVLGVKDKKNHLEGLISVLHQLHQELDAAVADAYGWPPNLSDEETIKRLLALNRERAAEEHLGHIRWLRPDYQNPKGVEQVAMELKNEADPKAVAKDVVSWPQTLSEQAKAVHRSLLKLGKPATAKDLYSKFKPVAKSKQPQRIHQIDSILTTLHELGLIRKTESGQFAK